MAIHIPTWVFEETTEEEIIREWSLARALRKMQEYARQEAIYRQRYGLPFEEFEKRVLAAEREDLAEWDDYVVWRGLHLAAEKWRKRYQDLVRCTR